VGLWSNLFGGVTPNDNDDGTVGQGWLPGDPDGFETQFEDVEPRAFSTILPSPWSGWPEGWNIAWNQSGMNKLIDTAWACLDLNSNVLSTMPVYRTRNGEVMDPATWMHNPDPLIYTSWHEFAKQLFWDYMMGEAFVLPMSRFSDGDPMTFRVIPPWLVNVEMGGGGREYRIGSWDVTDEILHIRYPSTTDSARGVGPLEAAGARVTAAGMLTRYVSDLVGSGGVPYLTLETEHKMTKEEADELREQWVTTRMRNLGKPAVLHAGLKAVDHQMSPRDMAMLEISQFTEARIAVIMGVPPFLVGLTLPGSSETYANVLQLFDFHDRASLRPRAAQVMSALSG
jgi:HK97 family phage portal protein